ncbi:MAG: hypothetical protein DMG61_03530, partial [Acidobacteria bacterium]
MPHALVQLATSGAESKSLASLKQELSKEISGEVRFDDVSRALYSTDASVYQIRPLGVVLPKTTD